MANQYLPSAMWAARKLRRPLYEVRELSILPDLAPALGA